MGFLTKEERLVFLTLSICLLAGGIFQLVNSVFELPEEISLPSEVGAQAQSGEYAAPEMGIEQAELSEGRIGSLAPGTDEPGAYGEAGAAIMGPGDSRSAPSSGGALSSSAKTQRLQSKLDLNRATAAELDALPGIGPALAARILEKRSISGGFRSVDELLTVRGIGKKTLAKFRQWVYVSAEK